MTNKTNDPVNVLLNAGRDALNAADAAEGKAARIAHHVAMLLGNEERFGAPVVAMLQWAKSEEATKSIRERILMLAECDADGIRSAVEVCKTALQAAKVRDERRALAAMFTKAVSLLGAFAVLQDKHGFAATWRDDAWRLPVVWFLPENMEAVPNRQGTMPHVTFVRTKGALHVAARKADDDDDAEMEMVRISPTMQACIEAANKVLGRTSQRAARQPGSSTDANGGNAGQQQGSTEAGQQRQQGNASPGNRPPLFSDAADVVSVAAGKDDYKHKPTGKDAEAWQTLLDSIATNMHLRAMMVRAISRANKADGDAAEANAKRATP